MFLDTLEEIFGLKIPDHRKLELAERETDRIRIMQEEMERERILGLRERFRGADIERPLPSQSFSHQKTIDLSVAHKSFKIWSRGGNGLFITFSNAIPENTKICFDGIAQAHYPVRKGVIRAGFREIFLTNTAQAGGLFKFMVAQSKQVEFALESSPIASTPHTYSVTMTLADTDYEIEIPAGTKAIYAILTDGAAFSIGVGESTNKTYVPDNTPYIKENLDLHPDYTTLYFMCGTESKIATVRAWS